MTTATPQEQLRLLDVQALDTKLNQLRHRRRTFPEHAAVAELDARRNALRDEVVTADTERGDVARELTKSETDVEQVRGRITRDQERLASGVGGAKSLEGLQHELESLLRRQGVLEDIELEIMERLESATARTDAARRQQAEAQDELTATEVRLATLTAEIDATIADVEEQRRTLVAGVGPPLLALYEKIRDASGGSGAAMLRARTCQGCRLTVSPVEMQRIAAAAPDEVLRCEECSRILVRTDESGL